MNGRIGVKTYNELNTLFLKENMSIPARFWYLLRDIDDNGSGYVTKQQINSNLADYGLTKSVWRTARSHPLADVFFVYSADTDLVYYRSLENVCITLQTNPGLPVYIPRSSLSKLKIFNAYLYATFFVSKKGYHKQLSRKALGEIFGITKQAQIAYEKATGMRVDNCIMAASIPERYYGSPELQQQFIETLPIPKTDSETYSPYWRSNGCVYWQTANKFISDLPVGRWGKVRKIRIRTGGNYGHAASRKRFFVPMSFINSGNYVDEFCAIQTKAKIRGQGFKKHTLYHYTNIKPVRQPRKTPMLDARGVIYSRGRLTYNGELYVQ